ncbi:signal peptidase I [Vagococcus acidifermentans]|uniref:Signal peptidase I n=1 Tax=Vagococcus acidifermentans TaxID=564710 RepID=A0A430AWY4_9ENTE|nr:signal peptidase I [Vagococcus acidifermentans]RSU12564.1 signal peptidase I [Vagococcus acidifermentans]
MMKKKLTRKKSHHKLKDRTTCWAVVEMCYIGLLLLLIILSAGARMTEDRAYLTYHLRVVLSKSMEPAMPSGSLVVTQNTTIGDVQKNDIVTFKTEDDLVSHRVKDKRIDDGETVLITQGDNNETIDREPVTAENIQEKVLCHFPLLGKFLLTAQKPAGVAAVFLTVVLMLLIRYFVELLRMERRHKDVE